ncbi:hypothetical protein MY3296_000420 [Beauveria thailandica]
MSSVCFNASVAVYDAVKNEVTNIISFPGLSGDATLHSTGVRVDPLGHLSVVVNAGAAFDTFGKDLSGNNFLVKYDLERNQTIFTANLTAVSNGAYGGFQDVQHTENGESFVLGTYGRSSILRVSADGSQVMPWFVGPPLGSSDGFSGLALRGHDLIVANQADGQLYRFDTRREEGVPVRIPLGSGNETIGQDLDAVYMPPRYGGRILLVSRYNLGTVVVRSRDASWRFAEKLGTIPNPYREQGALSVATVEMGARLYSVNLFSNDVKVQGSNAGNRTVHPLQDISDEVEKYSTL